MPDINICFLDIQINTTTTSKRKKESEEKERKKITISHRRGGYQVVRNFIKVQNTVLGSE